MTARRRTLALRWPDALARGLAPDGTLRDIYVEDTTITDWSRVLEHVAQHQTPHFSLQGASFLCPADVNDLFLDGEAGKPELSFNVAGVQINCHFFTLRKIEFDIEPGELTESGWIALLTWMADIADLLKRRIRLTHENSPDASIVSYDPKFQTAVWDQGRREILVSEYTNRTLHMVLAGECETCRLMGVNRCLRPIVDAPPRDISTLLGNAVRRFSSSLCADEIREQSFFRAPGFSARLLFSVELNQDHLQLAALRGQVGSVDPFDGLDWYFDDELAAALMTLRTDDDVGLYEAIDLCWRRYFDETYARKSEG